MFGINQISWGEFTSFVMSALFFWYLSVFLLAFVRYKSNNRKTLFENDQSGPFLSEGLKPITVSARDYPSELVPFHLAEAIPLPVSFYEETGLEEGYPIDSFLDENNPCFPELLRQIQFQQ